MIHYPHYETIERRGTGQPQFGSPNFEVLPTVRAMPIQHNQAGTAAEVNYVELELPLKTERPRDYSSVSGADPRLYATARDPGGDVSPSLEYGRGTSSHFHHHASSIPNLYATLDYRRGGTATTTTAISNLYATLPHRRDYFAASMSTTSINISPPGFRDIRMSLRTPLVRRPSESAV